MSKFVQNKRYINHKVSFKNNYLHFNDEGIAEVPDEHTEELVSLDGYSLVGEVLENEENTESKTETEVENVDSKQEDLQTRLNIMTIKQLNRYAASENIDLGSATKKEDIISAIISTKESE